MPYARIHAGTVAELFTPPAGVAISQCFDSSLTWVDAGTVSPAPQLGWAAAQNGGQWTFAAPPPPPPPSAAEVAAAAYAGFIAAGLSVTSTGTPAVNGVYAIDDSAQANFANEALFIATFQEFTTQATSNLPWALRNGTMVTFPTAASFLSVAKVVATSVAAAKLAATSGGSMPPSAVTVP